MNCLSPEYSGAALYHYNEKRVHSLHQSQIIIAPEHLSTELNDLKLVSSN